MRLLPLRTADDLATRGAELPAEAVGAARRIVEEVRRDGVTAVQRFTERFGERVPGDPLVLDRAALRAALDRLGREDRVRLERVTARIRAFAEAQRGALTDVTIPIPGGLAGQQAVPVERAGCYVPGGRYPLPSSALMTAIPARVAGVPTVWVATPRAHPVTLAAAALAEVDGVLLAGGAHAIAALAFGAGPVPAVDVIVGPGNVYVTAAKQLVAGRVGIDMLAGPSELVILAEAGADPALVAADLLAQAEHDVLAVPILVTTHAPLIDAVEAELRAQLADLTTAEVARAALANGGVIACDSIERAIAVVDRLAPEHLEVLARDAAALRDRLRHCGAVFLGAGAAEVLGDYGAGPNHTLPTGRAARFRGGLSVYDFLRVRTWMTIENPRAATVLADDAAWLGRVEGLEAHARAAERRNERTKSVRA